MWFKKVFNIPGFFVLFFILLQAVRSLRVTDIYVPRYAELGSTVILRCNFTLGSGKLNSVKWYKDEIEFFRYLPEVHSLQTNIQIFPQSGLTLDISKSDKNQVSVTELTFNGSGIYKCEVSSDAPDFKTDTRNGTLSVNAYLKSDPVISGVAERYSPGETIAANCTAGPSNPAPHISWLINTKEVDLRHLRQYHTIDNGNHLYTRSVGLLYQVDDSHFKPPREAIKVQCKATVADITLDSYVIPHRMQYKSAKESSSQRFSNNSSREYLQWCVITLSVILILALSL